MTVLAKWLTNTAALGPTSLSLGSPSDGEVQPRLTASPLKPAFWLYFLSRA